MLVRNRHCLPYYHLLLAGELPRSRQKDSLLRLHSALITCAPSALTPRLCARVATRSGSRRLFPQEHLSKLHAEQLSVARFRRIKSSSAGNSRCPLSDSPTRAAGAQLLTSPLLVRSRRSRHPTCTLAPLRQTALRNAGKLVVPDTLLDSLHFQGAPIITAALRRRSPAILSTLLPVPPIPASLTWTANSAASVQAMQARLLFLA